MSRWRSPKTWHGRRWTSKPLSVDPSARAEFYRAKVRRGEAASWGGLRYSHLAFILWCFFLVMLFRDVAEEARLRGERTGMRCATESAQVSGSPR